MGSTWRSAQDVTRTVFCAAPNCDEELDAGSQPGDHCTFHKLRPPASTTSGDASRVARADADGASPRTPRTSETPKPPAATNGKPSYPCKTAGCENTVSAQWGRFSFCTDCQIARGTRAPDGRLILRNPKSPGSHERKKAGLRARDEVAGSHERAALELVDVARRLDLAAANYEGAQTAWRAALERLPAAS